MRWRLCVLRALFSKRLSRLLQCFTRFRCQLLSRASGVLITCWHAKTAWIRLRSTKAPFALSRSVLPALTARDNARRLTWLLPAPDSGYKPNKLQCGICQSELELLSYISKTNLQYYSHINQHLNSGWLKYIFEVLAQKLFSYATRPYYHVMPHSLRVICYTALFSVSRSSMLK